MSAAKWVYGRLSGVSAVTDLVGTRITPHTAFVTSGFPRVTYQVIGGHSLQTLGSGPDGLARSRVQVDCWGQGTSGYADVQAVADACQAALDGHRGTAGGVVAQSCEVLNRLDSFEPPADASDATIHRVTLDLEIFWER